MKTRNKMNEDDIPDITLQLVALARELRCLHIF